MERAPAELPAGVPQPDRRDHRLPRARRREQLEADHRLLLDRVARRLRAQRIEVEFTDEAVEHLAETRASTRSSGRGRCGARSSACSRTSSRSGCWPATSSRGQRVRVELRDGRLRFDVVPGEEPAAEPERSCRSVPS